MKKQIPVRTFADWDHARPGFLEVDLVAHCGESTRGEYLHTLTAVDVATGWCAFEVLPNRGQQGAREAIDRIRKRLPFPLLGIDCDNDSALINAHLLGYCTEEGFTLTQCRPYKKNDQAHVEKCWNVIRKLIGYDRHDTEETGKHLETIYADRELVVNFFPAGAEADPQRTGGKQGAEDLRPSPDPVSAGAGFPVSGGRGQREALGNVPRAWAFGPAPIGQTKSSKKASGVTAILKHR